MPTATAPARVVCCPLEAARLVETEAYARYNVAATEHDARFPMVDDPFSYSPEANRDYAQNVSPLFEAWRKARDARENLEWRLSGRGKSDRTHEEDQWCPTGHPDFFKEGE